MKRQLRSHLVHMCLAGDTWCAGCRAFAEICRGDACVLVCVQDFGEGGLAQQNLDAGANKLIPVPEPLGGVIVLGESVIAYFGVDQAMKVTPIAQTMIRVRSAACSTPSCGDESTMLPVGTVSVH